VAPVKLYLTSERRMALPAVCPSAVPARLVAPPSVQAQWQDSALLLVSAPVAVVGVPAGVPATLAAVLAPSARVAVEATGSARVEGVVRTTAGSTGIDENHVASAAQLKQRGTTGFSAKHDMTAPKPNGGVRGTPPRGRPV
jgi:hypothetical protein